MSHVFPRHTRKSLPTVESGDGVYLIDNEGKRYLDACGGAAVSCLGHSNQRVIDAVSEQLGKIAYAHTSFFTSEPAEQLADTLIADAPDGIDRVYFVSGGSEAVEASLKLARQYFLENGEPSRQHVIARLQSYHGNTLGALAAGGNLWRRAQFQPLLSDAMHHIDPCHFWRYAEPGESEPEYGLRVADQLEQKILELGEGNVAAFIAEPVVGATMGAVAAVSGYFRRIREICDRYGVLLIVDEVMCGMGRTGELFAIASEEVLPDIICIAKGLGAGVQPIGAMLCTSEIYSTIELGSGFFQHGHTYLAHPAACAGALAVMDELRENKLIERVQNYGPVIGERLQDALGNHPNVGDIRGRGFFLGIELVADGQSKEPLSADRHTHSLIKQTAFDNGLMVYPMGGSIDGVRGDHILLAPPFILSEDETTQMVELLSKTVHTVCGNA